MLNIAKCYLEKLNLGAEGNNFSTSKVIDYIYQYTLVNSTENAHFYNYNIPKEHHCFSSRNLIFSKISQSTIFGIKLNRTTATENSKLNSQDAKMKSFEYHPRKMGFRESMCVYEK